MPTPFEDIGDMVRRLYQDEVVFHDGKSKLAPGREACFASVAIRKVSRWFGSIPRVGG